MGKSISPHHLTKTVSAGDKAKPDSTRETLAQKLARARTANEITSVIGLRPIRGRSGPKIAY